MCIMTSDLWGVDGIGVVRVGQQVDVEAKRNVAHGRDLVLGRAAGVQQAGGGELQLLQSVETQTLHEGPLNLTEAQMEEKGVISKNIQEAGSIN